MIEIENMRTSYYWIIKITTSLEKSKKIFQVIIVLWDKKKSLVGNYIYAFLQPRYHVSPT